MLALFLALLVAAWLFPPSAYSQTTITISTHASIIVARTGDRTPFLGDLGAARLTPLGAHQLYSLGDVFRRRYVAPWSSNETLQQVPIVELSEWAIESEQLYVLTGDEDFLVGSAQAFMQGLYPPYRVNESSPSTIEAVNALGNGSFIDAPLNGYQYPQLHTASPSDYHSIYVGGDGNCVNWALSAADYYLTPEFAETDAATRDLYSRIGAAISGTSSPSFRSFDYANAFSVYDVVNYFYTHSPTTYDVLNNSSYSGDLEQLRALASQQQWAFNANLSASHGISGPGIRGIAGATLAAKVLELLEENVQNSGSGPKVSVLVTELEPFFAFFSLADLAKWNSDFLGLPEYGSAMAFELYSIDKNASESNTTYPDPSDLWVRFLFHNGSNITGAENDLTAYPLFGNGPSATELPYLEFVDEMRKLALTSVGDWCDKCQSYSIWCAAYNASYSYFNVPGSTLSSSGGSSNMTPQVAGVIGAVVTLGVIGLLLAVAVLLGGIRFHRLERSKRKSELGGFKGGAKLASDADLSVPKVGVAGVTVEGKGRERVGSWELKGDSGQAGMFGSLEGTAVGKEVETERRKEQEEDLADGISLVVDPFADPVRPDERV